MMTFRVASVASVIAAVAVLPLMGCATTSGGTSQAAELAAITEFNKKYLGSINDGDIATLSSLTTEGHIMITPGRPPIVGKKANDEANGRAFQNFNIVETWTPVETVIAKSGDLAFQRGTYTVQATPKTGGNPASSNVTTSTGTFMRIYQKQPNGEWRMVRDMFNNEQPSKPAGLAAPAQ